MGIANRGGLQEGGFQIVERAAFSSHGNLLLQGNSYLKSTLRLLLRRRVWGQICYLKPPPSENSPFDFPDFSLHNWLREIVAVTPIKIPREFFFVLQLRFRCPPRPPKSLEEIGQPKIGPNKVLGTSLKVGQKYRKSSIFDLFLTYFQGGARDLFWTYFWAVLGGGHLNLNPWRR